jgi:hypothetical protein
MAKASQSEGAVSVETTEQPLHDAVTRFGRGVDGISFVSEKSVRLDRAKAQEFLDLPEFEGERPRRDAHVASLANAMRRQTFRPERADISVCNVGGKQYRVNGQHTCAAVLEMPAGFSLSVKLIVYEAKTMKDLQKLYASIDRGAARTKGHVTYAYLVGTDLGGFKPHTLKLLPAAYALWRFHTKHSRTAADGDALAVAMLGDDKSVVMEVGEFLDGLDHREDSHMFRAPVAAAMMATYSKVNGPSKQFWTRVADGNGFSGRNDPRRKLREALKGLSLGAGSRGTGRRKGTSSEAAFRGCLHSWNAWRSDESLQLLRFHDVGQRPEVK